MKQVLEIEVFRAGDYGGKGAYAAETLKQIAEDYDPSVHEAPVTLDHRQAGPAFGWVEGLRCAGEVLVARVKDMHESLRDWIRAGAYKKRSIELYRAFGPTGRPYLRAVSFLGACPPEVKGLADPVFTEDDDDRVTVEFEDAADDEKSAVAAMNESAEVDAVNAAESHENPTFAELEALREERTQLATELDAERADRRRAEHERFCDALRRDGRILPAWEANGLVAFMLALGEVDVAIETADGRSLSPLEWFREFLRALPRQVELGEMIESRQQAGPQRLSVPQPTDRATIRPSSLALHERAVAWCEQHENMTYVEALQAVSRL